MDSASGKVEPNCGIAHCPMVFAPQRD